MATRFRERDTRWSPSSTAIAIGWYLASILVFSGALLLIDHCRPPNTRHAALIPDRETFNALAMWLVGIALLFFVQQFIDSQVLRYVTILPFAFSWFLCSAAMIEWFNEEPALASHSAFYTMKEPVAGTNWWFYPLRFALVGLPAPAWLLTFRSMPRRESVGYRRDVIDSFYESLTNGSLWRRHPPIQGDARLSGLLTPADGDSPRKDGPRPGSTRGFDSLALREDLGILGLKVGATREDVRHAYRDLVLAWHPDRFPLDPHLRAVAHEKMSEINAAHDRLERHLANRSSR
jgi:hypothetical protein